MTRERLTGRARSFRDEEVEAARIRAAGLDLSGVRRRIEDHEHDPDLLIERYRDFLALQRAYSDRPIVPSETIDEVWHKHILDTRAYLRDTIELFGRFLHHYPYFGLNGDDDRRALEAAFNETVELTQHHFGYLWNHEGCVKCSRCSACRDR